MSALADKNTKGVADGIENTMGRGLEVVFGIRGIKSEMFARYVTFTSWSYKKAGQSTLLDLKNYGNVPTYDLTTGEGGEFDLLIKAIEKLETWGKITYL